MAVEIEYPEMASPIDLAAYLPYLIHRLGAWTSPRRAIRLNDGRIVRLREWRVLMVIAAHGRLTGADVSHLTSMDSGSTTRAVHALLHAGLIVSQGCTDDRRRTWLTPTVGGIAVHAEIAAQRARYNDALLEALDVADREHLFACLGALQRRAEVLDGR